MKNRKILIVLLAMLLIVSAVGCAAKQPAETAAPAETKTDAPAEPAQTEETGAYVIGFNNYNMGSDFPQQLYAGLEAAAAEAGVEIMYAEAAGDPQKMVSNIDAFITAGVDLVVDFNFNPEVGVTLVQMCDEAQIPLISIDCYYEGAYFFGVNNLLAGKTAGAFAAELVADKWDNSFDELVLEFNDAAGPEVKQRLEGIVEALQEAGIEFTDDQVTWIDFNNDETKAQSTAADFLTAHPDSRKILFGVLTDPASAGVLAAIETAKRSDDCMIVSHGGEDVGIEMLKKDNCFQGTVCYDPAKYGEGLIPLAVRIIHGEQAEVYNYAQQYMLTRDNLG